MFRSNLTAFLIVASLTKATFSEVKLVKEVPLTVVQHNLTHLRISWKTQLSNIEPLYILINESKISPYPKKLKEGEADLKLNPCLSHSLCLGKPPICVTSSTTYIPGKQCQSNETAEAETVVEPEKNKVPAIAITIVLAGFGLGLGLTGLVSAIIIAFSKRRTRKETCENPNPLYGNYYFEESNDRCNIEVELVDRNGLYGFEDSYLGWEGATLTDANNSYHGAWLSVELNQ